MFGRTMLVAGAAVMAVGAAAQEIEWHSSYAAALAEARDSGKPLIVAFRCVP